MYFQSWTRTIADPLVGQLVHDEAHAAVEPAEAPAGIDRARLVLQRERDV
jgi:hypothetical protein